VAGPHDYGHSHATWLDAANLSKVIQMDRRGHTLQGMDRVYMHVTRQMRERLCAVLEELWQDALTERYKISPHSHVPLLDDLIRAHETAQQTGPAPARGHGQAAKICDLATVILPLDLGPDQAQRSLPLAVASSHRPPLARLCPPICPREHPADQGGELIVPTAWATAPYSRNPAIHAHILGRNALPPKGQSRSPVVEETIKTANGVSPDA
jgi:hypothetical protein